MTGCRFTLLASFGRTRLLIPAIFLFAGVAQGISAEPDPPLPPKTKSFSFTRKGAASGSRFSPSLLEKFTKEQLKKSAELDSPVAVSIVALGRSVEGLESIHDRIVDVRITNPNPYALLFRGRQYKDNLTIVPQWNTFKNGVWTLTMDLCGTGVRDYEVAPNATLDLMLYLHPEFKEQQILGRFYRIDKPSMQSDCLLYEKQ